MDPRSQREVSLYVKSRKAVTSFYRPTATQLETTQHQEVSPGASISAVTNISPENADTERAYMLPDDQAHAVSLVQELAPPRGYSVRIVDVARTTVLQKLLDTHLKGVEHYPVLVVHGSGRRLEGPDAFRECDVLSLLPADLTNCRAFTHLKVKPAEVDVVRLSLLNFDEVKEVHVVSGDWDILAVLEFPLGSAPSKRAVFDFIIQKVAKIPGVEDTSTMIPEYSVTKFPL